MDSGNQSQEQGRASLIATGWAVALTALMMCAASGCHHHHPGASLQERTGGGISERWSASLPEGFDGWVVEAHPQCVTLFAWSSNADEASSSRTLRCHDPDGGALLWEQSIPVPAGFVYDRLHLFDDRIIYQNNHQMIGFDASDGQVVWVFDANDWVIGETVVADGRIVTSLSHEVIAVLNAHNGHWIRGVEAPNHRLINAWRRGGVEHAVVVLLQNKRRAGDSSSARLAAVRLDVSGGRQPSKPFAKMALAWELPINTNTYDMQLIGGVLVGHLTAGELWGVGPDDGEVLYQVPDKTRAALGARRDVNKGLVAGPEELNLVNSSDLSLRTALNTGQLLVLAPGQIILSQGHRTGVAMNMLEIQGLDPTNLKTRWRVQVPSQEFFRQQRALSRHHATLIAGGRFFVIVDTRTGRALWRKSVQQEQSRWTSVASDGRGLYVVYGQTPEPRLEAYPIR